MMKPCSASEAAFLVGFQQIYLKVSRLIVFMVFWILDYAVFTEEFPDLFAQVTYCLLMGIVILEKMQIVLYLV